MLINCLFFHSVHHGQFHMIHDLFQSNQYIYQYFLSKPSSNLQCFPLIRKSTNKFHLKLQVNFIAFQYGNIVQKNSTLNIHGTQYMGVQKYC
jgi:hypothetical protein